MKLKLEDKLKIIDLYKEGWSVVQISNRFNIVESGVRRIEKQYREHGISSFKPKGKITKYTNEFKISIIKRILNGESELSIATELCANEGLIHSWLKKYNELGYNGLINKKKVDHLK